MNTMFFPHLSVPPEPRSASIISEGNPLNVRASKGRRLGERSVCEAVHRGDGGLYFAGCYLAMTPG